MTTATMAPAREKQGGGKSSDRAGMVRTLTRMRLWEALSKPVLVTTIEVGSGLPRAVTTSWDGYWGDIPASLCERLTVLETVWRFLVTGSANAQPYCHAYMALVQEAFKEADENGGPSREFLGRVLGFENFVLKFRGTSTAFAAATTSFRSPLFLSSCCVGLRRHARNDPSLLPLVVGCHRGKPQLYYHYGKQKLLKNTGKSVLFFPAVEEGHRGKSFAGLDALTTSLASAWESRINERSRLLADKVLVPLLSTGVMHPEQGGPRSLRVLDIGSGVGLFTSRLIGRLIRSKALGGKRIELSLLDIFPVDPKKHFRSNALLPSMAKLEYVQRDYAEWVGAANSDRGCEYDVALLCRILHNRSRFRVARVEHHAAGSKLPGERYRALPHLSDYYEAVSLLFPGMTEEREHVRSDHTMFHPSRVFNPTALVTPNGESLIDRLAHLARGVLIEDADLTQDALVSHLSEYQPRNAKVFDLSRSLRLSINHIYWITRFVELAPSGGELVWPR